MTANPNEKRNESSSPSLVERCRADLDEALRVISPNLDGLIQQLNRVTNMANRAKKSENRSLYRQLLTEKRIIGTTWLHDYETIQSRNRDYLLALEIEKAANKPITPDETIQKAIDALNAKFAKTLSALFDAKGHERMYGAGSKSPARN